MGPQVACIDCKHGDMDEEEAPCKYCEGLDHFEVAATPQEIDTLRAEVERLTAENDRYKAALEWVRENVMIATCYEFTVAVNKALEPEAAEAV